MPKGIYRRSKTHRLRIAQARLGQKHSRKTRKKIGDSKRGRKLMKREEND